MSLTDKTRKSLWARSGNRCLLCRLELVQRVEDTDRNLIVGEECHIISAKEKGPRASKDFTGDYDSYENMVLLCATDHKRIDELTDIYTVEKLKQMKAIHEDWVKSTLERDAIAFTNDKLNVKSLPIVATGQQLLPIIQDAHIFDFYHDELRTTEEAELVGGFLEELKDDGDVISDMGFAGAAKFGIHLNEEVERLRQMGFLIFGLRRKMRIKNNKNEDLGEVSAASVVVMRSDSPAIVGNFLIASFPAIQNIGF